MVRRRFKNEDLAAEVGNMPKIKEVTEFSDNFLVD